MVDSIDARCNHEYLFVCLYASISAGSTGRISTEFDTGDFFFINTCQDNLNLTKFEKKKSAKLHDHLRRFIAAGDTNSQQRHLCALFDIFILFTVTHSSTIRAKRIFAISIARMVT